MTFGRIFRSLLLDESASVLAEYALILGVLSLASITVLAAFGNIATTTMNTTTATQLQWEQTPPG